MRYSLAPVAFAAFVAATPVPQGVTEQLLPDGESGCPTSYDGTFNIQIVNVSDASARMHKRQDPNPSAGATTLALTLEDGILKDAEDRTGYIAANSQFQFDAPPQTGATITAGWSVCPDGRLNLGDEETFYSCRSGDFYNLYDENVLNAQQCNQVYINVIGASSSGGSASQVPDGQPQATPASQIPDGQPQATPVEPVSQIPDGQPQATPVEPVSQIPDGQIQATPVAPVSQIPDGQIQATPVAPVSQIPDGQIQATPVAPVSQIPDGQVQATPVAPVSQIPDGQIQATPVASGTGYMPSANGTMAYPSMPVQQTGAAVALQVPVGIIAAIFGVAML